MRPIEVGKRLGAGKLCFVEVALQSRTPALVDLQVAECQLGCISSKNGCSLAILLRHTSGIMATRLADLDREAGQTVIEDGDSAVLDMMLKEIRNEGFNS